jgi:CubicO group peptidase (beta-lactamase class C family)
MLRFAVLFIASVVVGVAQDVRRMEEVAASHASNDRFMGSVLVAKDDAVVFERSYGWASVEWSVANTATTRFRIGSVTKQFTAAAILLLEERGKLTLQDPVAKHVPDAPEAWKDVTLYHLLTHTSGVPSFTSMPEYAKFKFSATTAVKTVDQFRNKPLDFAPGEKFAYSNSGYVLLGYIVELVSGQPYATFVGDNIFKRLGMGDTGLDSSTEIITRRASGYAPGGTGLASAAFVDMSVPHGAGAMYSTPRDLWKWQQGLYGHKLLSAASVEKMTKIEKSNYALGVGVQTVDGRTVISHGGGIEGFNSHLMYLPAEKMTVVVLANVNGPSASQLCQQLSKVALGEAVILAAERKEIEVPAEKLKDYVGTYQLNPRIKNMIRLTDGRLTTQLSGQGALPLFAESETKFFLKVVDAQVEFVRENGRVTHLLQHQNGRTQKAERVSETVVERIAIEVPRAKIEKFVGTYQLNPNFALTVTLEGDQLMSQATGQAKFPLFPESETKFFLKVVDAQLEFFTGADGAVTHAVLHQGGREMKAERK